MSQKYYYKLVSPSMKSIAAIADGGSESKANMYGVVTYNIGKWIEPIIKGTDLFVFATMDDVRKFVYEYWAYRQCLLFKVEVKGIRRKPLFLPPDGIDIMVSSLIYCARLRKNKKETRCSKFFLPSGCVGVSQVKLIERIPMGV